MLRAGAAQAGEEKAPGRPYCGLSASEGADKKAAEGLCTRAWSDWTWGNAFKPKEGRFRVDIQERNSLL